MFWPRKVKPWSNGPLVHGPWVTLTIEPTATARTTGSFHSPDWPEHLTAEPTATTYSDSISSSPAWPWHLTTDLATTAYSNSTSSSPAWPKLLTTKPTATSKHKINLAEPTGCGPQPLRVPLTVSQWYFAVRSSHGASWPKQKTDNLSCLHTE